MNVARELERLLPVGCGFEITLISRENYLLITPLRFEAGSGLSEPHHQRRSPARRHESLVTVAAPGTLFPGGPKRQRAHARILNLVAMANLLPAVNAALEALAADQARLHRGRFIHNGIVKLDVVTALRGDPVVHGPKPARASHAPATPTPDRSPSAAPRVAS